MRLTLCILLFMACGPLFGQQLKESFSEKNVLIGSPTTLTYEVITNQNDVIKFTPKDQNIEVRNNSNGQLTSEAGVIEVLESFKESSKIENGKKHWTGTYTVVVWDSGSFVVPGPQISVGDSNMHFQDLRIHCDFSQKKSGVDIYDIREDYAELPAEENEIVAFFKSYWWIFPLLTLLLIGLWLLIRKRKAANQPVKIVKAMSLKDRTLMAIDALEDEKLWEKEQLKQHYVELSYILRSYLTTRYDISLLEKTTHETKALLLQLGLNDDTVDTVILILSQADMVKFAKSKPEVIEILKISTLARQIVAETSPLEFDNYE